MRNAYAVIAIGESNLQQFIGENCRKIGKPKEAVIGEDDAEAKQPGNQHRFVGQRTERRVTMNDLDAFADQDVPHDRNIGDHCRKNALVVARSNRKIVHFQAIGHVANTLSVTVRVCDYNHL